jgi:hypothetical protein
VAHETRVLIVRFAKTRVSCLLQLVVCDPLYGSAFLCRLIGACIGRKYEYLFEDELKGLIATICIDELDGDCKFDNQRHCSLHFRMR